MNDERPLTAAEEAELRFWVRDHPPSNASWFARLLATLDAERAALRAEATRDEGGWNMAHGLAIDVLSNEAPDGVREHAEEVERQFWGRASSPEPVPSEDGLDAGPPRTFADILATPHEEEDAL